MSSWHIIPKDDGTGYSIIQRFLNIATEDTMIIFYLADGISYSIDGDSSVGLQEESIMFQVEEGGQTEHILINMNYVTHVEIVNKTVVKK